MAETAIVSFYTLPVGFPFPTVSKNSLYTLFCSLIIDHGVLLKISNSVPIIIISNFLLDTSFRDNQVLTSSDESPGHTIPILQRVFFHQLDVLSQRRCVDESAQDQQNKDCAG